MPRKTLFLLNAQNRCKYIGYRTIIEAYFQNRARDFLTALTFINRITLYFIFCFFAMKKERKQAFKHGTDHA